MFKSTTLHKTKMYGHGLSTLLMQNPYSKFILAIKTLIFDRFSNILLILLRQIEIQMLNRKYFPCPPAVKNSRQKFIIRGQFLARLHEVQKSYCSHPGRTRSRSRSRSTLLKFSRSLYLGNHSSESIHTWTIGTQ